MYKVFAATREDMNEGWVWLSSNNFPPRPVIKIENKSNRKKVYCEALKIDENYLKNYNDNRRVSELKGADKAIVVSEWYRKRLGGIETKQFHDLKISISNGLWGKFRASIGHPQVVVRLATWLAVISVTLGALGIFLALYLTG